MLKKWAIYDSNSAILRNAMILFIYGADVEVLFSSSYPRYLLLHAMSNEYAI